MLTLRKQDSDKLHRIRILAIGAMPSNLSEDFDTEELAALAVFVRYCNDNICDLTLETITSLSGVREIDVIRAIDKAMRKRLIAPLKNGSHMIVSEEWRRWNLGLG